LLIAIKKRSALRDLHEQLRSRQVDKRYHALVGWRVARRLFKINCGHYKKKRIKVAKGWYLFL